MLLFQAAIGAGILLLFGLIVTLVWLDALLDLIRLRARKTSVGSSLKKRLIITSLILGAIICFFAMIELSGKGIEGV